MKLVNPIQRESLSEVAPDLYRFKKRLNFEGAWAIISFCLRIVFYNK